MKSSVCSPAVGVIDIGSNSIKLLVAARAPDGSVASLAVRTIDARISAGISHARPRLSEDGMVRGLDAIRALLANAAPFAPVRTALVATSAVRDAENGSDFQARVRAATGHAIRILTGDEEANLIGRGLTSDPEFAELRDFYVFDLGGGSLECLTFRDRRIQQAASLQLGCVRLMEKFVADPTAPFSLQSGGQIAAHCRDVLARGRVTFSLPTGTAAVGTGGTMATARAILGARAGIPFERTEAVLTVGQLRELLTSLGSLPLPDRRQVPGLPQARADVFPTALATFLAIADAGHFPSFRNSLHNLRYGLAAELLDFV